MNKNDDGVLEAPTDIDNEDMDKAAVRASKKLWGEGTRSVANPKQKNPGYGGGGRVTLQSVGIKKAKEELEKKQGVPKGVDPAKHERCVLDVKAEGKDKSSAYAICNASMSKSEIDKEIDEMSDRMEKSTMNPVEEIKKAIMELGPQGLKKALPEMDEENRELLNDILEDMSKSHKVELAMPKKLVNVAEANYVEEYAPEEKMSDIMVAESAAEGDDIHKHQGGAHDMAPEGWEGQIIKALMESDDENAVVEGLGAILKAWDMKKKMKKKCPEMMEEGEAELDKAWPAAQQGGAGPSAGAVAGGAAKRLGVKMGAKQKGIIKGEHDEDEMDKGGPGSGPTASAVKDRAVASLKNKEAGRAKGIFKADEIMEKIVSASPKLWGKPPAARGVGIKSEQDDGKEKLDKGDEDSVAEDVKDVEGPEKLNSVMKDAPADKRDDILRELRESKVKKAKELLKNMMYKEMEDKDGEDMDKMKKKMRKALVSVLSEEYTDEEIQKAADMMDKGGPGSGRSSGGSGAMAKERLKALDKKSKKSPVKTVSDPKQIEAMGYAVKKGWGIAIWEQEDGSWLTKAVELGKDIPEAGQVKMPAELMKDGKAGKVDPALAGDETADEAIAGLGKMKKSIRYYGDKDDAFKAGRLGRHNYASSVNEYYNDMLTKADSKEEELKKSEPARDFSPQNLNDLVEMDFTCTWEDINTDRGLRKSESEKGGFTRHSFDEVDMLKSLNLSKEDADKIK